MKKTTQLEGIMDSNNYYRGANKQKKINYTAFVEGNKDRVF